MAILRFRVTLGADSDEDRRAGSLRATSLCVAVWAQSSNFGDHQDSLGDPS